MKVIALRERESRRLHRGLLFDEAGRSLILETVRALKVTSLRDVEGAVELRAIGVVGYFPITDSLALDIVPKFALLNFWRMVELAGERFDRVLPLIRSYAVQESAPPQWILARVFCGSLKEILAVSPAKKFISEEFEGYLTGRPDFARTVSRFLSRGDVVNVASHVFRHSRNVQINGIVKSACIDFLRIVSRTQGSDSERRILLDGLRTLDGVLAKPMWEGDERLAEDVPEWCRLNYLSALQTYALYLGHYGISISHSTRGALMPSFLFRLDSIFERMVRNTLVKSFAKRGVEVRNGNLASNNVPLFLGNSNYSVKPDVIIGPKPLPVAIIEVKYRGQIDEDARYQLISHVIATGCNVGLWVSPAVGTDDEGLEYVGVLRNGESFYSYRLDLSGDLDMALAKMADEIEKLVIT